MPAWIVARSGTRSAISAAIAWSIGSGSIGGTSTSGRSVRDHPSTWLTCTELRPNVRGICSLTSRKIGQRPTNEAT